MKGRVTLFVPVKLKNDLSKWTLQYQLKKGPVDPSGKSPKNFSSPSVDITLLFSRASIVTLLPNTGFDGLLLIKYGLPFVLNGLQQASYKNLMEAP